MSFSCAKNRDFGRVSFGAAAIAAAFCTFAESAVADPVRIDLAALSDPSFSTAGCSWDSSSQCLSLDSGEYFIFDSAWNSSKPTASGSYYQQSKLPLSIKLLGSASIAISNIVVDSSKYKVCTSPIIDLDGSDLALTLCGASNRFIVYDESTAIAPAIRVPAESRLEISGTGALYAELIGGASACIGSGYAEDSGAIIISSGTLTANHKNLDKCRLDTGLTGAAIGSGAAGNAGRIEVHGGIVTATSEDWAAGIGAGANYKGDKNSGYAREGAGSFDIEITGGTVIATGGKDGGCGIGGGHGYDRATDAGATTTAGRVRILGGTVSATACALGSGRADCAASAIGASMRNPGAIVVIDSAATVKLASSSSQNHNLVSGPNPTTPGALAFTCASGDSDGHAFLTTDSRTRLQDVHPTDSAARESLPWRLLTRDSLIDAIVATGSASKGYTYAFDPASPDFAAAVGALEGLPIRAFSLDGENAYFTISRVSGAPTEADKAAFSTWFSAFGADIVAIARDSLGADASERLAPKPDTLRDNGDGTANFKVPLTAPLAPARFFQVAW